MDLTNRIKDRISECTKPKNVGSCIETFNGATPNKIA